MMHGDEDHLPQTRRLRKASGRSPAAVGVVQPGDSVRAVAGGVDFNGDGHDDYVATSYRESTATRQRGAVRIFSGKDGSVLALFRGLFPGDQLGWSVAIAGDVDADGTPAFLLPKCREL